MKYLLIVALILLPTLSYAKKTHITILQANDVYEMTPVNGGKYGGLARVQTLIKKLKKKNRHTYTILAGDLISPSAIGTAKVNGTRLNGKQMVDVLNYMEWDFFTLGNHEFDNGRESLIDRLTEAKFTTVSANVIDTVTGRPFVNTVPTYTFMVDNVRVALAGITLQSLSQDFVKINDPMTTAKDIVAQLKEKQKADIIILITHQDFEEDLEFAKALKDVDLILGGHEHENIYVRRGPALTPIAKADANARSVYIHELYFDSNNKTLSVDSTLKIITDELKEDRTIKKVVGDWKALAFDAFKADGFEPEQTVTTTTESLDGLEASVRNGPTRLTEIVARSALSPFPGTELSLINAGSIRIDDTLPPGPITQYDVIRILPFGGTYIEVSIPGDLLEKALNVGMSNRGTGGFLHHSEVENKNSKWLIKGKPIKPQRNYKVATASFLIERGDAGLEFLVNNPRIQLLSNKVIDARIALILELERTYSTSATGSQIQAQEHPKVVWQNIASPTRTNGF